MLIILWNAWVVTPDSYLKNTTPEELKQLKQTKKLAPHDPLQGWSLHLYALDKRKQLMKIKANHYKTRDNLVLNKEVPYADISLSMTRKKIALKEVHDKLQHRIIVLQRMLPRTYRLESKNLEEYIY